MTITLQFCRFESLAGRAITYVTGAPVGHVDIALPDGRLLGAQFDSGLGGMPSGVQIRPPDYGGMTGKIIVTVPTTTQQESLFLTYATAQIGKPYDIDALAGFVVDRDWRQPGAWDCAELVAAAAEYGQIISRLPISINKITPAEMLVGFAFCPKTIFQETK